MAQADPHLTSNALGPALMSVSEDYFCHAGRCSQAEDVYETEPELGLALLCLPDSSFSSHSRRLPAEFGPHGYVPAILGCIDTPCSNDYVRREGTGAVYSRCRSCRSFLFLPKGFCLPHVLNLFTFTANFPFRQQHHIGIPQTEPVTLNTDNPDIFSSSLLLLLH